jgi:LacI family transcriptional regulator
MVKRPTQEDVARLAGVSRATVSYVINDRSGGNVRISDETRKRVMQVVEKLGYQPNVLARSLRDGETHTIGIILPDSDNPFFAEVARGVEDTSFKHGYSVILCNSDGDLEKEQFYSKVLAKKQVDGILFLAAGDSAETLESLVSQGVPLAVVDREVAGMALDTILTHNAYGGQLATRHLLGLGHQRIGCIRGPSNVTPSAERFAGYQRALAEAGVPLNEQLIKRGDFQFESGQKAARELLILEDRPTALFACNDLMAIGAISTAVSLGFCVPNDLSVVGFDDIRLASVYNPALTTVVQPKYEMGVVATEMLLERVRDPQILPRRRVLDTSLVVRLSTAPLEPLEVHVATGYTAQRP